MNLPNLFTKKIIQIIILFSCFTIIAPQIVAQQTGISLSPSLTEIVSKPGNTTELTFALENLGDPALVSLKMLSIQPSDYFGNIKLETRTKKPIEFNSKDYSFASQKSFIMKSHEIKKINLTLSIPENTQDGDYYYALIAQTDPPPGQEGSVVSRASIAIASNILISVAKNYPSESEIKIVLLDIPESYLINIFGKKTRVVDSSQVFNTIFTVQNKGMYRIKPEGSITLRSGKKTVNSYILPAQNILAEWQRTLQTTIPNRDGEVSLTLNKITPGFYNLRAVISVPGNNTSVESAIDFVAIPFALINGLIICIALVAILVFLKKRRTDPDFESA